MNANAQPQRNEAPDYIQDTKNLASFVFIACRVIAAPVEAWLRVPGTVGDRYWSLAGPVSLLVFPLMCCLIGSCYPTANELGCIVLFWIGTLGFFTIHRFKRLQLESQGVACHSRSVGDSWLDPKDGKNLLMMRLRFEMLTAFVAGCFILPFSSGLGFSLWIAAIALAVNTAMLRMQEAAMRRSWQDAYIDMRDSAQQMGGCMG